MQWYYEGSDGHVGPVSEDEFESLIKSGTIRSSTLVWNSTMTDWQEHGKLNASTGNTEGYNESVCSECGRRFSRDDMIRYGESWVCAECKPVFVQKLKEGVTLSQMDYAGFWIRFGAIIIDGIILVVISIAISIPFLFLAAGSVSSHNPSHAVIFSMINSFINIILYVGYETFFIGKWGATLGKMACGLKVVSPEGEKISYLRAFARYFAKILSSLILLIGYIMAAFDGEKRALHDRICSTRVIRK